METTFIYALCEPDTRTVRYIGKADNPEKRLRGHVINVKDTTHKVNWIRSLLATGQSPKLVVLRKVPKSEWQDWERRYIQAARCLGMCLTNYTNGGEGGGMLGHKQSLEARAKMSAARRGPKNHNFGKKFSLETCKKLSVAHTGRKDCFETCRIRTAAMRGLKKGKGSSQYVGVSWHEITQKWKARITVNKCSKYLGIFDSEETAAQAYDVSARKFFGDQARTNFSNTQSLFIDEHKTKTKRDVWGK